MEDSHQPEENTQDHKISNAVKSESSLLVEHSFFEVADGLSKCLIGLEPARNLESLQKVLWQLYFHMAIKNSRVQYLIKKGFNGGWYTSTPLTDYSQDLESEQLLAEDEIWNYSKVKLKIMNQFKQYLEESYDLSFRLSLGEVSAEIINAISNFSQKRLKFISSYIKVLGGERTLTSVQESGIFTKFLQNLEEVSYKRVIKDTFLGIKSTKLPLRCLQP